jgi:DNA-binding PadR family transcriptional regulator
VAVTLVGAGGKIGRVERRESLSLSEWAVLACLAERPRHGYDIAAELAPAGELGAVWRVTRPLVYRALERLEALGLIEARHTEAGEGGPPRVVFGPRRPGRDRLARWLAEPVAHLRDVRSALLLKLVVAARLGVDTGPLVAAQRARFAGALAALAVPPPPGDAVASWRHRSGAAVAAFLDDLDGGQSVSNSSVLPMSAQMTSTLTPSTASAHQGATKMASTDSEAEMKAHSNPSI